MNNNTLITLAFAGTTPDCGLHRLLKAIFPGSIVCNGPGLEVLQPAAGMLVELYSSGAPAPAYLTQSNCPLISFQVADLDSVIQLAQQEGAIVLIKAKDTCTGFSFCHLQWDTGCIVGFFQP